MTEMLPMRKAYGEALLALGHARPDVVALSADVSNSDFSYMFAEAFPIASSTSASPSRAWWMSQSAWPTAAKSLRQHLCLPVATRALEMIRTHLCYGEANVKLMAAYAGISDSFDGPTHHAISDVAIMRSLPKMTVVVPGDTVAVAKLLPQVPTGPVRSISESIATRCR